MSDPDSVAIAAGMARYFSHDTSFKDIILYGRQMNPGIYLFFRLLYPALFDSPSMVMPFLNFIGVASAVILPVPLFYVFRRKLGDAVAAAAVLLFIFTPLVWETSLSFHPVLPAALLLSLACLTWRRIDGRPTGRAWFAVTCLLAMAALVT
ncbi:MAG: glycosyltransferase family 39 protein, partial [bacterium]